jgi:hypothetical protein
MLNASVTMRARKIEKSSFLMGALNLCVQEVQNLMNEGMEESSTNYI